MTKGPLLTEDEMTKYENQGRTNLDQFTGGPDGTFNNQPTHWLFDCWLLPLCRRGILQRDDSLGRSAITLEANRVSTIAQRRSFEKARHLSRPDRVSRLFGLRLALNTATADGAFL